MKHIHKGAEPPELTAWKLTELALDTKWERLPSEVTQALRRSLFEEQGHICCYCGCRLLANDGHIEHFVPRNGPNGDAAQTFEHGNLLASCQGNVPKREPLRCGKKKDDWYDAARIVSPLSADCEARFHFELDGRITGASALDDGAKETISRLDLDGARLRSLRRSAIEALFAGLDAELTKGEYERLADSYQRRDEAGKFEEFCFVLIAAAQFFATPPPSAKSRAQSA